MTMTLRSSRDGSKNKRDGLLVRDSELDSFRQGYSKDQRQAININQPVKAYKGKNGMIQFVPYSAKKDITKKVPVMLDSDFDTVEAAAKQEIINAAGPAGAVAPGGGPAGATEWKNLNAGGKSLALKALRKLQKVSISTGMIDEKQWDQIIENLGIKTRKSKNDNTTDYMDMREEVDKRIKEYAGKRSKNGFAKTVDLKDEEYKKYINKYLKSVRNYYMEENELKVLARPVYRHVAVDNRNIRVNVNAGLGPAGVAVIAVGGGAAESDYILGSGLNPESTPKTTTVDPGLIAAGPGAGFFFSTTQHAVRAGVAAAGTKSDAALLALLTPGGAPGAVPAPPAPGVVGNRFPIIGDALTHNVVGGIRLYSDEERAAHELPALQRFEKMRDIIKTPTVQSNNALDASANAPLNTKDSQISVFSDGVYYDPTNKNDKALKSLKDLIEKLFKIFIDRTKRFLEENPDADETWTALDGGNGKKNVKKSAKKSTRAKKGHSGSKKHKKMKSVRKQ